MIKEQIEKAAKKAIHECYNCNGVFPCIHKDECKYNNGHNTSYDCAECGADDFNEGFIKGADWRINSVWHDNSEEPNLKDLVIVLTPNGGIFDFGFWEVKDKIREGQLWARMYDLIPCVLELDRLKVREKILSEEIIIDKLNINDTDNGRQRK